MQINTALILCAGFGKRLKPFTLTTPKPLLEINNITLLERCINLIIEFGAKKIILNTFHLSEKIFNYIQNKKFPIDIQILEDGNEILDTGGGILNMMQNSKDDNFIIFNPDTLWEKNYLNEIKKMQEFYFLNKLNNILLLANKRFSFDKNLMGDFELKNNLLKKKENNDFIYIGCQILNRNLFEKYKIQNFSILSVWNELLKKNELNGFESLNDFYHLTNLEILKKLKDF